MLNYFNEIVVNNKIHFKKSDGTKCVDECGTQIDTSQLKILADV